MRNKEKHTANLHSRVLLLLAAAWALSLAAWATPAAGDEVGKAQSLCVAISDARDEARGALDPVTCVLSPAPQGRSGRVWVQGFIVDPTMQASAQAAAAFLASPAAGVYRLPASLFIANDIVFRFEETAWLTTGTSAGTALALALYSAATGVPVMSKVCVSGGVDAAGKVGPVGGIAAKLEAARIAGAETVILPRDNSADLAQVPGQTLYNLRVVLVSDVRQALFHALGPYGPEAVLYNTAVSYYRAGIQYAAGGDWAHSWQCFTYLSGLTPEDYSVGVWLGYLRAASAASR